MSVTNEAVQTEPTQGIVTSLLPANYFFDPAHYAREQELIFERSWMHVGHASLIPNAGDYMVRGVGSQEVIVLRDKDGEIGAFYNVCRHRARELLQDKGNVKRITCPYHGWTYDLDGRLVGTPHLGGRGVHRVEAHDPDKLGLKPVRVGCWNDLVVVNIDDSPTLLRNDGGNVNNWLTVALVGKAWNRQAIGARVTLTTDGRRQSREARAGTGYLSQDDSRMHFGLGQATVADRIVIRWPDGQSDVMEDVAGNRLVWLTEGQAGGAASSMSAGE